MSTSLIVIARVAATALSASADPIAVARSQLDACVARYESEPASFGDEHEGVRECLAAIRWDHVLLPFTYPLMRSPHSKIRRETERWISAHLGPGDLHWLLQRLQVVSPSRTWLRGRAPRKPWTH